MRNGFDAVNGRGRRYDMDKRGQVEASSTPNQRICEQQSTLDHERQVPVPEPSHMESSLPVGVSALAAASKVPASITADFTAISQAAASNLIPSATVPPS